MTSDFEVAQAASRAYQRCSISTYRNSVPGDRLADLDAALDNPLITSAIIARVIRGWGFGVVSEGSIQRHRRGGCQCVQ